MTGPSALAPRNIVRTKAMTAFRHRNYRLFFAGQAISLVGTWMQQVAQAWLVLTITGGDPLWLGVVAAAQFLPVMVLGLFAGILADVLPKRQTLLAAQVVMMVLAAVLAFLTATGLVQVWHIVLLAVLLGCANAVDMPARQSFAYEMVGPRDVGQCGRAQLRDVQRRPRRRSGRRRADDRPVRHRDRVRDQRLELRRGHHRPADDARQRAADGPAAAATANPSARSSRTWARGCASSVTPRSCCWGSRSSASSRRSA